MRGAARSPWFAVCASLLLLHCGQPIATRDADATPAESASDAPVVACTPGLALSPSDCDRARALRMTATLPPARGNRYGDDNDAATLGFRLFFSNELGRGFSCAACHLPELAFTDRVAVSTGVARGNRNAPTIFNAGRLSVMFWDGRADTLWSQPLFAVENPLEMASSRLAMVHLIANTQTLRDPYERAFGPMPDVSTLPAAGRPGDPQFDALPASQQTDVQRVTANAGKAFEAYMRRNSAGPAPLDAYLSGDANAISAVAREGLRLFATSGCMQCHRGPMLTDEGFHNVAFPSLPGSAHDPGRAGALEVLRSNPFNLAGAFADPPMGSPTPEPVLPPEPSDPDGAFRTPSLRNVTETAPYGHDGALNTLSDVMGVHASQLSPEERGAVIAFLRTLVGTRPPLPWSNWPQPL